MKYNRKRICSLCCLFLLLLSAGCANNSVSVPAEMQSDANSVLYTTETASVGYPSVPSATANNQTTFTVTDTAYHAPNVYTSAYEATETTVLPLQVDIAAPYAGLYNARTMECLYSRAQTAPVYPASLTKIITACTALAYVSPETVFTVGTEQMLVPEGSSLCLIQPGHKLTLGDLLTGMLLCSGNDAAYAVAANVAREVAGYAISDTQAIAYFAELMNEYAADLGAANSHFTNPVGWDDANHYTTVHDLALIAAHAMQIDIIRNIVSAQSRHVVFASGENITWHNTNALLQPESRYYLPQANGMKTGTTEMAGHCLIATVTIDGAEYIAVVAGCDSDDARYIEVHKLINMIQ